MTASQNEPLLDTRTQALMLALEAGSLGESIDTCDVDLMDHFHLDEAWARGLDLLIPEDYPVCIAA
ncbi:MAG: hypothetical protein H6739_10985 [Alphaproteobacteria bacterium]|nr:hypothetical protein [Alphaproteobacteria bacterium]